MEQSHLKIQMEQQVLSFEDVLEMAKVHQTFLQKITCKHSVC